MSYHKKVFDGYAEQGNSSTVFFGLKLHISINNRSEINTIHLEMSMTESQLRI
ncbi:hypothetical protein J0Q64_003825 [Salmonella enterica subsp. enterica serovar Newport]|nr:hypothetical protein [Salmonella enterica subsp. enterica serovar Newport]EJA5030138.1 hypothetical protein [Salmonella enterica]HBM0102822.1 hypothetical protein [Salmonella enterica subsp. enterica serovar Wedding]EJA5054562.1 hypothetical protein [Salmonella enterica]EJA5151015.1 hypothetical protein [Salmonella enterica]